MFCLKQKQKRNCIYHLNLRKGFLEKSRGMNFFHLFEVVSGVPINLKDENEPLAIEETVAGMWEESYGG